MDNLSNLDVSWRTLLLFGCWFPTLLIALQLVRRETEAQACYYLAAFVSLFALGITPQIIGFSGFYQVWPWLTFAPFNTDLWLGPLLLLHLRRLCLNQKTLLNSFKDVLLLLPGVIQSCYYSVCFLFLGDYKAKWAFNDAFHEPFIVPLETVLVVILTLVCLWQSYQLMQHYQSFLNNTQSQADTFIPIWFKGLFYGILVLAITWFLLEILSLLIPEFSYTNQYPFYLLMSLIVLWCGIQALTDIKSPYPKIYDVANTESDTKSEHTDVTRNDWQQKADTLFDAMTKHQWYLKPDLCLRDLATSLGTNQSYLSKTINEGFSQNFNQFVNEFRVKHAQQALRQQSNSDLLSIAYDSGFNSKASFNRIFKAITQMTPGQYRLAQSKKA